MTFLLGKDKLVETKKDRGMLVLLCLVPSFLYVGLVVVFFLTSSRSLMHIYPILLSIISTIYASYLLFYFTVFVRRYTKMTNLCKEAMEKRQYEEEMVVYSIDYKSITVRGVVFNTVTFFHLDDDKKSIIYVLPEYIDNFVINKKYTVRTLQSILVAFEETNNEESH